MTPLIIILVLLFGTLLFIAEVFYLPSGIFGKIGFIITIIGLFYAIQNFGAFYGSLTILLSLLINGTLIYFGAANLHKSSASMKQIIDGKVNVFNSYNLQKGDIGLTLTELRPEGKVVFEKLEDEKMIVWANNGFINADAKVQITSIKDNKIFVQILNS